eukprot:CAMPEP_0119028744 /NCGR_PEP_ID=MMETSP1176-20130426/39440_1 /TAXON_ID=265551 /ORGANISM="Synedropsis recta cf, Strain CCMP1620" /LENGTH=548 /DNA_ID=CAMNT_0006984949 /DNA_START=62 /DNA_END=1708 /DNA_ORIENTATION=-
MSRNQLFGVGGLPTRAGLLHNHPLLEYIPNHVLYPEQQAAAASLLVSPSASLMVAAAAANSSVEQALLNPMDANSSMPKKKGATFHQQPNLPPFKYLHCRDYYAIKGSDRRRISAMMIGVSIDRYGFELDIDEEPFCGFKRELRPTNLILQEELLRRAVLSKARVLPRPAQWEKEKIVTALKDTYPPRMTDDDVLFMKMQVRSLVDLYWKKKDNAANDNQATCMGWESTKSHLRFYHVLLKKKADLANIDSDDFWRDAANLMNNLHWIPSSVPMPQIGMNFAETLILPFLFAEPIKAVELEEKLAEAREKLGNNGYISPHLHYFMALIQQNGLDPILFSLPENIIDIQIPVEDDDEEEEEESIPTPSMPASAARVQAAAIEKISVAPRKVPVPPVYTPPTAPVVVTEAVPAEIAPPPVVSVEQPSQVQEPAQQEPAPPKKDPVDDEKEYIESSKLHLKQMELYNSMENEWFALEEKSLTADESIKTLYQTFAKRKQTSLKTLKRRLMETAEYTDICSKRIHLMEPTGDKTEAPAKATINDEEDTTGEE